MIRVITKYDPPPSPDRDHDWSAQLEGAGEDDPCGWGPTEQAAIEKPKPRFLHEMTADEIFWPQRRANGARQRI